MAWRRPVRERGVLSIELPVRAVRDSVVRVTTGHRARSCVDSRVSLVPTATRARLVLDPVPQAHLRSTSRKPRHEGDFRAFRCRHRFRATSRGRRNRNDLENGSIWIEPATSRFTSATTI